MKYGLLTYRTRNLGDDIQSLAVRQYLPRIDERLDRESLHAANGCGATFFVANGWFLDEPAHWPPAANLNPFFFGVHMADPSLAAAGLAPYYRQFAPIGCRDLATVGLLERIGVDAYFSGCPTLSLERPDVERTEEVVLCDVDWELVPPEWRTTAVNVSHWLESPLRYQPAGRMAKAEQLLWLYARAKLVVTGRLHAALPCLAFGTPVVLARPAAAVGADQRLGGFESMLPVAISVDQVRRAAGGAVGRTCRARNLGDWQRAICREAVQLQANPLRRLDGDVLHQTTLGTTLGRTQTPSGPPCRQSPTHG